MKEFKSDMEKLSKIKKQTTIAIVLNIIYVILLIMCSIGSLYLWIRIIGHVF